MKKLFCAALALLLLCGCSPKPQPAAYTLEDGDTLIQTEGLFDQHMAQLNSATAAKLYGLDESAVAGCVSWQSTNTSVSADELTILILTGEDEAQAAEEACRKRVESQIAVCSSYAPAAVPRLEGAVISRLGCTVLLAVGDPELLPQAVEGLHG